MILKDGKVTFRTYVKFRKEGYEPNFIFLQSTEHKAKILRFERFYNMIKGRV